LLAEKSIGHPWNSLVYILHYGAKSTSYGKINKSLVELTGFESYIFEVKSIGCEKIH